MGFPIQAGSEKILELMKREYTANDAKKCILSLKQKANGLPIYTHVIVGFPNEEEEDFQESMKFFETVPFKGVASYKFSDRPNTPASEMFPKVSEEIKKERLMRLNKVIKQNNGL
jgi:tRNA A37 methylthiotransferase MiaB